MSDSNNHSNMAAYGVTFSLAVRNAQELSSFHHLSFIVIVRYVGHTNTSYLSDELMRCTFLRYVCLSVCHIFRLF